MKHIEHCLNIQRSEETKHLDGFDAVHLWYEYQRGSKESLELLIKYDSEDIVNLKKLVEFVYSGLKKVYTFFNNCHEGKTARNAQTLKRKMS